MLQLNLRRKHEAIGLDAPQLRLPPKILLARRAPPKKPKHTAIDPSQNPHPDVEHFRRQLEIAIETAVHEPVFGQSGFGPGRYTISNAALGIIDLIAIGKANDALRLVAIV